jgi:1-acyl-sn-glycerol-3-phosphate acyltransferase
MTNANPMAGTPPIVAAPRQAAHHAVPNISTLWLKWFTWYSRRYIRRHFHSLRISRSGKVPGPGLPLVIYSNHASWWDPLVCLVIKDELFPELKAFAPIDDSALKRYRMLGKFGFFGVEQGSRRGGAQFLRTAEAILRSPNHMLALTPQSRFADARERPVHFHSGIGHLATRVHHAAFVPVAVEYVYWQERLPEILVHFGESVEIPSSRSSSFKPAYWTSHFEQKLSTAQDELAIISKRRNSEDFQFLLRGGAGQGGIYDRWRSLMARLRGEIFHPEHQRS